MSADDIDFGSHEMPQEVIDERKAGGLCVECGAPVGEVEPYCGASICPHGDCLHNHHDGCPACWPELKESVPEPLRGGLVALGFTVLDYELEVSEP